MALPQSLQALFSWNSNEGSHFVCVVGFLFWIIFFFFSVNLKTLYGRDFWCYFHFAGAIWCTKRGCVLYNSPSGRTGKGMESCWPSQLTEAMIHIHSLCTLSLGFILSIFLPPFSPCSEETAIQQWKQIIREFPSFLIFETGPVSFSFACKLI